MACACPICHHVPNRVCTALALITCRLESEYEQIIRQERVALEHCKLDLQDRLNARRHKDERRRELADGILRRVCSALQLAVRLCPSAQACAPLPPSTTPAQISATHAGEDKYGEEEQELAQRGGREPGSASGSSAVRRRAARVYSDAEIKRLLRCCD
jgi:hypothetical protein